MLLLLAHLQSVPTCPPNNSPTRRETRRYPNFEDNQQASARERSDFTTLLSEMYPACKGAGLLLTAATRAHQTGQHYELGKIHQFLDW